MDFVCLNGSVVSMDIKPSKYPPRNISEKQTAARERIKQEYGDTTVLEEFPIPKTKLRLDFFLPNMNVAVEVHGRQHFEFVKHFHGTRNRYAQAKRNDELKKQWCDMNGIELIVWSE